MSRRPARTLTVGGVLSVVLALGAAPALAGPPADPTPIPTATAATSSTGSPSPVGQSPSATTTSPSPGPATSASGTPSAPTDPSASSNPSTPSATSAAPRTSVPRPIPHQRAADDPPLTLAVAATGTPQAGVFFEDLGRFAFSGTAAGDSASAAVAVCRADGTRWTRVATATVTADGRWSASAPVTFASAAIGFRATLGTACPGSTGTQSNQVTVAVRNSTVTVDKPPATINSLKNPVITGRVYPARAGVKINLDILRSDKTFRVTQQTTTDAQGRFAKAVSFGVGRLNTYTTRAAYRAANRPRWEVSRAYPFTRIAVLDPVSRPTNAADVAKTYRAGCPVGPSKLRTVWLNYYGLRDRKMHRGVIIIRADLADDLTRAFGSALTHRYPIAQMVNPNVYGGNDPRQMEADNTSGFNCRKVTGNPYAQSPHSYGTALDVNTVENPYRDVRGKWWPSKGKAYIKRTPRRPGMLTKDSYLTKSLRKDDFFWGGFWNPGRDYQHFQR